MFIVFHKPLDIADHGIPIYKLNHFCIGGVVDHCVLSYLPSTFQFVSEN